MQRRTWLDLSIALLIVLVLAAIVYQQITPANEAKVLRNNTRVRELSPIEFVIGQQLLQVPANAQPFPPNVLNSSCTGTTAVDGTGWIAYNPQYLNLRQFKQLPRDPLNPKQCYIFKTSADGKTYKIEATLELDRDGSAHRVMADDGGTSDTLLEFGNNRQL